MEQQGEYRRWLPTEVQNLGGADFAELSGRAPVIGLQYLMAKKPEIEPEHRQENDSKIVTFLKRRHQSSLNEHQCLPSPGNKPP
jgi:hypothetical protein